MSNALGEENDWQFNEIATYALEIAGHKGHKGVLDSQSVAYLAGKLEKEQRKRGRGPLSQKYGDEIVRHLYDQLPQLRAQALFTEGGGLELYATAMCPSAIPHAGIRASAASVAELFNIGRQDRDKNNLNFAELSEALKVLSDPDDANAAKRTAMLDKAEQSDAELKANLEVVRDYMSKGKNDLLVSGTVQFNVGLRNFRGKRKLVTRRLKFYELPDQEGGVGGTIESEDAARKRAENLEPQLLNTACDRLYLYSNRQLYVALNPCGDIRNLGLERRVQMFDNEGEMTETAVVVVQRDVRNSVGESTVGWYVDTATAMGRKAEELSDPNTKGNQLYDAGKKPNSAKGSDTGMFALAAGAGVLASLSIRVPQLALGVVVFGSVPIVINLIKYFTNKKSIAPVENAMGVTVTRSQRRH